MDTTAQTVSDQSDEKELPPLREAESQVQTKHSSQKGKTKKPKRNKSAFILFSVEMRAKLKHDVQDQVNSNDMMVKLAELWKNLPKPEKEKYNAEAKSDKMRYLQELDDFAKANPTQSIHNKTKKNHVKKPCSSYAIFLKEMKGNIKEKDPSLKMADVLKIVSEKWKNLSGEEKIIYQDRAQKEKELAKAKLDISLKSQHSQQSGHHESSNGSKKIKVNHENQSHAANPNHAKSQNRVPSMNTKMPDLNNLKFPFAPIPEASFFAGIIRNHLNSADTSLFEGIAKAADQSLTSMANRKSNNNGFKSSNNKDIKQNDEEEEGRQLFGLLDKTIKASSELIIDLLNFSLPSERFDTLNLFDYKAQKAHSNVILSQPPVEVTNMYKDS